MAFNRLFFYLSNQHNLIVRILIFLFSVALITFSLPREGKFKYEFSKGKVWLHEDYIAPFDFAIKKTDGEINKEVNFIEHNSKSYYRFDEKVLELKQQSLINELRNYLKELNSGNNVNFKVEGFEYSLLQQNGNEWLSEIYSKGIFQHENKQLKENEIIIEVKNNIAQEKSINEYYNLKTALNEIATKLYGNSAWRNPEYQIFFEKFLTPNLLYSDQLTISTRAKEIGDVSTTRGMISKGELLVEKGEIITPEKYQVLDSVKDEFEEQLGLLRINKNLVLLGQTLIVSILMGMLLAFLILLRKDLFQDAIKLSFLFSLIVIEIFAVSVLTKLNFVNVYIFPFCIIPIIIRAFFDTRLALIAHLLTIIIIGFIVPNPFEFLIIQLIGGMSCIFSIVNLRKRSQLFLTITLLFIVYCVCYVAITLVAEGQFTAIKLSKIGWLGASASLTLFSYPIIYIIEKVFGFTSDVSLLELSDSNNSLLKAMAIKAPGTFQHSLQVANLAEAAVAKVGGNSLLTRTGALYHDIGKMETARYFIENQLTGVNPHDELGFDESARIIISHVKNGIQLARKHNLPENVIDFIRTHHGTSRVQYFYHSFLKSYPTAEVDETAFRYPGPIPYSRETAIVMMADAVEATSRSLKDVNSEKIDNMVEAIINQQITDNQFINANITFKDITVIKKIFKKMLMNIYHIRMEYPK
jgi:putative nucleotidyltransferase with HDIG domain